MTPEELKAQIEREVAELKAARIIHPGPPVGRCHFCGRVAYELFPVEVINEQARHACTLCAAGRQR